MFSTHLFVFAVSIPFDLFVRGRHTGRRGHGHDRTTKPIRKTYRTYGMFHPNLVFEQNAPWAASESRLMRAYVSQPASLSVIYAARSRYCSACTSTLGVSGVPVMPPAIDKPNVTMPRAANHIAMVPIRSNARLPASADCCLTC